MMYMCSCVRWPLLYLTNNNLYCVMLTALSYTSSLSIGIISLYCYVCLAMPDRALLFNSGLTFKKISLCRRVLFNWLLRGLLV